MPAARTVILGEDGVGRADRADEPLDVRPRPLRPPAVGALLARGTTGLPKAIVQSQGGILLEHLKMLHLHVDAQAGDRLFWFTTTGWMMWNFIVSGLLTEATILLYDGSPGYPDARRAVGLRGAHRDDHVRDERELHRRVHEGGGRAGRRAATCRALKAVGSTGSPLSPEGFRWVYEHVGAGHLAVLDQRRHRPVHGVRRRRARAAGLRGRAAGARAGRGDRVLGPRGPPAHRRGRRARADRADAVDADLLLGRRGRLALPRGATSTPTPGVWRHGDWIEITDRGTAIISGRSDATINRGGIRMGTAEIYRAVLAVDAVTDALVVDVPVEGEDAWMPLFVVLREGRADRRGDRGDPQAGARGLLAAPRPERGHRGRRGPAHALGQGARAAGQADPDGHAAREGRRPRLARQPRRARPLRRSWRPAALPPSPACGTVPRAMVQPLTRYGVWILFVLAAANGLWLYLLPGQADTDYAWSIKPAVNAAFIGAGFLAGTLATGLVLWKAQRWRTFSTLPIALWVLAFDAAAGDDHPPRPLQVGLPADVGVDGVYAGVPIAIPFLVRAPALRQASRRPPPTPGSTSLRAVSAVVRRRAADRRRSRCTRSRPTCSSTGRGR